MSSDYFFMCGRNTGKTVNSIPGVLEYLFGGKCIYRYDERQMMHHYEIRNDDIGLIDLTVTNECFIYEDINVRITRMCEEYLGYMEYKFRDYIRNGK